jgi:uncharacterized repeat protein (TIGR01451 family)
MPCIDACRARRRALRACIAVLALCCAGTAIAGGPDLVLTIEDDLDFVRFGQVVDYRVTLANVGGSEVVGISWSVVVSDGLDGDAAYWTCYGAGAGATCTASGDGLPIEGGVALPAGRSLTWVVSVPVRAHTPDASVEAAAVLASPLGLEAADSNILVLLRDGFDDAYPLGGAAD